MYRPQNKKGGFSGSSLSFFLSNGTLKRSLHELQIVTAPPECCLRKLPPPPTSAWTGNRSPGSCLLQRRPVRKEHSVRCPSRRTALARLRSCPSFRSTCHPQEQSSC